MVFLHFLAKFLNRLKTAVLWPEKKMIIFEVCFLEWEASFSGVRSFFSCCVKFRLSCKKDHRHTALFVAPREGGPFGPCFSTKSWRYSAWFLWSVFEKESVILLFLKISYRLWFALHYNFPEMIPEEKIPQQREKSWSLNTSQTTDPKIIYSFLVAYIKLG